MVTDKAEKIDMLFKILAKILELLLRIDTAHKQRKHTHEHIKHRT